MSFHRCIENGAGHRQSLRLSFTPEKLAGLNQILTKRRVFSPEDIRNIATYFKLQESKCRIWFKENGARLRRQACSVRISPDLKKSSSDKRKSYVLKVRKRSTKISSSSGKEKVLSKNRNKTQSNSVKVDTKSNIPKVEGNTLNADKSKINNDASGPANEKTSDVSNAVNLSREVSNEIDKENDSVLLKADEIKRESSDVGLSGSDETEFVPSSADSSALSSTPGFYRDRDKFFHDLPHDKKIVLLKRTENLTCASSADAQTLATELALPFKSVYSWLKSKCIRNFRTWKKRLSREKCAILDDEFAASSNVPLTEERALILSYELDLSVCAIRKYFDRKKTEIKADDKKICTSVDQTEQNVVKVETLIENADCENSNSEQENTSPLVLVPQCVPPAAESNENGDASSGICLRSRSSLSAAKSDLDDSSSPQSLTDSENSTLKKRRFVLNLRQKKILIQQFEKTPVISPTDAASLATQLNLPTKAIQLWFHRKRFDKNEDSASKPEDSCLNDEEENQSLSTDEGLTNVDSAAV